jgi:hypothetical protein
MRDMTSIPAAALAPLGYRPAPSGPSIVPTYPPGFPMVMAMFERIGGPKAVFSVVPLLGGLTVLATYFMGACLGGPWVGLSAALLLATSPSLLFQLMSPMSDVPVAAWWALTLAILTVDRRGAAPVAGIAAGVAILTRPNLLPVAVVPAVWLAHRSIRSRSSSALRRALFYVTGVGSACAVVAFLNTRWYGGPLNSGYALTALFGWSNAGPNLVRYPRWLLDAHTPVVLCAFAAPFFFSRNHHASAASRSIAITWCAFVAAVFACYLFYQSFDAWWYLRFLLPAFPALFVLTSVGLSAIAKWLGPIGPRTAGLLIVLVAMRNIGYAADHTAFDFQEGERKYVTVADYIRKRMPQRAAFITVQYSGSIRYYSGRLTVRYDYIEPSGLDEAVEALRRLDYHPYILLEKSEEDEFERRFAGKSALAALNWSPIAEFRHTSGVKIYDTVVGDGTSSRTPEVID